MSDFAANPLMQNRRIALNPPPDGDVVDREVPLGHNLLQIAVGQRVSQVPPNAQEDDHTFEMSPAEQGWPSSGHAIPYQISSTSICNSANATPKRLGALKGKLDRGRS